MKRLLLALIVLAPVAFAYGYSGLVPPPEKLAMPMTASVTVDKIEVDGGTILVVFIPESLRQESTCRCGANCKCATTPNNPACKCDRCKCDRKVK